MLFFQLLRENKKWLFIAADAVIITISVLVAFWLRFEGIIPPEYFTRLPVFIGILIALNIAFIYRERLHVFTWAYVGLTDLTRLVRALSYASGIFALLIFLDFGITNFFSGFPRSVIFLSYFLNLIGIGFLRISKRLYNEIREQSIRDDGISTLIIGAGAEGERVVRDLRTGIGYTLVGIIDESRDKQKNLIHNVPVVGTISDINTVVRERGVRRVVIALPSGASEAVRRATKEAREAGITDIKIIPPFSEILDKKITFETLKDVTIEDLLGREAAKIDTHEIKKFLEEKCVLVTGAAGSIGSELVRQIIKFSPSKIIALDINESGLYDLEQELSMQGMQKAIVPVVANINDSRKIEALFADEKPQVVFHAAAYKHVPLMEIFPDEAVKVNIFGTRCVAEAARRNGVKKFVLISTDKAVRPTSVMGKTKRAAEILLKNMGAAGETQFVAVRFGNVLASRGSVIPLFQKQIKQRAAVTVTHPDMTRYFMTIPESALLVMEAGAIGKGGEIFLLDMGKPVKIIDLAREVIKLSGLEPDKDIPIVFTGIRPGEKIFEELLTDQENAASTQWEKIFISNISHGITKNELERRLQKLEQSVDSGYMSIISDLDSLIAEGKDETAV